MLTKEQIIARMPERLRQFDYPPPSTDIDDANLFAAYYYGLWRETVAALPDLKFKHSDEPFTVDFNKPQHEGATGLS